MVRPIVVGVHPSRDEQEPMELAVMLSCLTQAPLEVVGTYWFDSSPAKTATQDYEAKSRQKVQRALEDKVDAAAACSEVRFTAKPGSAAYVIHETARRVQAGLIVVGSTHRGSVGRALGSTTDKVLSGAPCPVAVAPRGYTDSCREVTRLGVAFVDTVEGRAALRAAAEIARYCDASLFAYTAIEGTSDAAVGAAKAALDRELFAYAGDLDAHASVLPECGITAVTEASRELDLLVTGSRGHGPWKATMLGGVSRRLAREASCPVIVIPRGLDQPMSAVFTKAAPSLA